MDCKFESFVEEENRAPKQHFLWFDFPASNHPLGMLHCRQFTKP